MWRVSLALCEVSICEFADSCACDSLARRWGAALDTEVLRSLKSDGDAMRTLRQIIYERSSSGLRSTDDEVVTQLIQMLRSGELRLCRRAAITCSSRAAPAAGHPTAERILALVTTLGSFSHHGQTLRIVPVGARRELRFGANLELVPTRRARKILDELAAQTTRDPTRNAALAEAAGLLAAADERPLEGRLVMLREIRVRPVAAEVGVTPSQFHKAPRSADLHWIEIELLGEDGSAIRNEEYLIVTSDQQKYNGTTDGKGRARLERIPAGDCKVSFPRLDREAWRFA